MTRGLTNRQLEVLDVIKDFIKANKITPTLKEVGDILGMASPSVLQHVRAIEKKGFLKREPFKSRSFILTEPQLAEPGKLKNPSNHSVFMEIHVSWAEFIEQCQNIEYARLENVEIHRGLPKLTKQAQLEPAGS